MTDFTAISASYERDSLIQKSAAEKLLGLLHVGKSDDVLDLGCGTGSLTRKICGLTRGRVVGIDPSEGMIREARATAGKHAFHEVMTAEQLNFSSEFDVIFCNSAFQWFTDPAAAVQNCFAALRDGGRMGIQAPARQSYCPNFIAAIESVAHHPLTKDTFATFRPPWVFLETAGEYAAIFTEAGFSVPFARIEELKTIHPVDEVVTIFESGAAAGYLNETYYTSTIDSEYCTNFRRVVKDTFAGQVAAHGGVELTFNRIYLMGVKE